MIPSRPSRIFRSRWSALFWAAGVIFTAVTTIGFAGKQPAANNTEAINQQDQQDAPITDALGQPVTNEDMAVLKKFLQ